MAAAMLLSLAAVWILPGVASAECLTLDAWTPFSTVAGRARSVFIGTVSRSLKNDNFGTAIRFQFDVDAVLRGRVSDRLDFGYVYPRDDVTCVDSKLRVSVGDRLAFAYADAVPDLDHAPLSVALISTKRTLRFTGLEYLSVGRIRSLTELPPTDSSAGSSAPSPISSPVMFGVIGGAFAASLLRRRIKAERAR